MGYELVQERTTHCNHRRLEYDAERGVWRETVTALPGRPQPICQVGQHFWSEADCAAYRELGMGIPQAFASEEQALARAEAA